MAAKKKAKRPRKETSDRVASLAGQLSRLLRTPGCRVLLAYQEHDGHLSTLDITKMVKATAGSALSQDEHRGKRGRA